MTLSYEDVKEKMLDAALAHVPFDGWTDVTFAAAAADAGIDPALARAALPRGAVDLALAYHARGDAEMVERLNTADFQEMRFRDKIAAAVRFRIEAAADREIVRRGVTLFSLPQYAPDGAKAIWGTCDLIWTTLGDTSEDYNWYTKRATLSAVYSSTLLYWLGDDSEDFAKTWAFLDRRIENVMQFEKFKADVNKNPVLKPFMAGPNWLLSQLRAPSSQGARGLPGRIGPRR